MKTKCSSVHVKIICVSDLKSMRVIRKLIRRRLKLMGVFRLASVAFPKLLSTPGANMGELSGGDGAVSMRCLAPSVCCPRLNLLYCSK